jgi:hypothetical protein
MDKNFQKMVMKKKYSLQLAAIGYILVISLNGCDDPAIVARQTNDSIEGINALKKVIDSLEITRIAQWAKNEHVRKAAVKRVTDQYLLQRIAREDEDPGVRNAAICCITNQFVLERIAVESEDSNIRLVAVKKLSDQCLLYTIAAMDSISGVSHSAAERVTLPGLVASRHAFESIPRKHRKRILLAMLPALRFLSKPEIVNEVGEIVSIKANWRLIYEFYGSHKDPIKNPGENFNCHIELSKLSDPYFVKFESSFPAFISNSNDVYFHCADINTQHLISSVVDRLSQPLLTKIAAEDTEEIHLQAAERRLKELRNCR